MLAYVDRPPIRLGRGPALALAGVRLWAEERRRERCPVWALRAVFARLGVGGALWPVHNFLCWMSAHAERPLELGAARCGGASDDETLLLAAMFADDEAATRAALAPLIRADALHRAVRCARAAGAEFRF